MPAAAHIRDDRDDRIEELEEELRQVREIAFGQAIPLPIQWSLSSTETKLLRCLMARERVDWTVFEAAMRADRWEYDAEPKVLDVFICKLRKKLRPYGVEIDTRWGQGWSLCAEMKAAVNDACTTGDPVVGPSLEREPKPELTAALIDYVNDHPAGVHVSKIRAAFADRTGATALLCQIAQSGLLSRVAKNGRRRGFTYYPARAGK